MSSQAHDTSAEVDGTQADKINTGALGTLVAVGLLAMLSITAAVTALVRHDMEAEESEKGADQNETVIALKNSQRGLLNRPAGYLDRAKGLVTLPIDVAKSVVVSELQKDPNSATPPASETASASAAPLNSATPPASATASASASAAPPAASGAPAAAAASAVPPTQPGKQAEPAGKPEGAKEKTAEPKPAPATSAKPAAAPASSATPPAALPKPTPTAATPGAESPGPVNH